MDDALARLCAEYGIADSYISATGERVQISHEIKRSLLQAMGVDNESGSTLRHVAQGSSSLAGRSEGASVCYVPDWLQQDRVWGVSTQLYAISSDRNQGIGDFEDLALLAELAAARGADFVGVNPLHALFWDDPERCSPYFPSTRQFLNPLYIAIDALPSGTQALETVERGVLESLRRRDQVEYSGVAELKRRVLRDLFERSSSRNDADFLRFCVDRGHSLESFARYETLSAIMAANGIKSGWPNWPLAFQNCRSSAVSDALSGEDDHILWHKWLQWLAHAQLVRAQERARRAGMRIGLYLDIAVGVAPDGAATWSDPELVTPDARIGCPPDEFNAFGQDWGLAPIIPSALQDRSFEPFQDVIEASAKYAGAVRIDHAMALDRLYWIPEGHTARDGGYVLYPREKMLDVLGRVSQTNRAIIIGEDLGTVPDDFRDRMGARMIHSYRVFYFERGRNGEFTEPRDYPERALACIGTHDLPTFRGWWKGSDIDVRRNLGLITEQAAKVEASKRLQSRKKMLKLLSRNGWRHPVGEAASKHAPDAIIADLHACIASAPSRLFVAQLEDLVGAEEQINFPGTHTEYPNWRKKLPFGVADLFDLPLAVKTLDAIAKVRTRHS